MTELMRLFADDGCEVLRFPLSDLV